MATTVLRGAGAFALVVLLATAFSLNSTASQETPEPVGDGAGWETCTACHDEIVAGMKNQIHMRIARFEAGGRLVGCEGCHGNGAAHAEQADPELIFGFDEPGDQKACLTCHAGGHLLEWPVSAHAAQGVECLDCHTVHGEDRPLDACQTCHGDVVTQTRMPSHHPIQEGKMSCASCHDAHAGTEMQLKTGHQRVNDLCYQCHLDKEGPFVFEHEPVVEDCRTCHTPHGSVADNLLVANEPMLCLQCHDLHFHAGYRASEAEEVDVGGIERDNPHGPFGFNRAMTTQCTQCHVRIHGSDLPSQSVPSRGRGLTQ